MTSTGQGVKAGHFKLSDSVERGSESSENEFMKHEDSNIENGSEDSFVLSDTGERPRSCPQDLNIWNDNDLKQLKYLINYDLSSYGIKDRLAKFSVDQVLNKARSIDSVLVWTKPEVIYITTQIQKQLPIDKSVLPFRSQENIQTKSLEYHQFYNGINNVEHDWSYDEIGTLFFQSTFDLTQSCLNEELPGIYIQDIKDLGNWNFDWTTRELQFIIDAKYDENISLQTMKNQLPFRTLESIEYQLEVLDGTPSYNDINVDYLEWFSLVDGTKYGTRLEFPGISSFILKRMLPSRHRPLSEKEEGILNDLLSKDTPFNSIVTEFPLRSSGTLKTIVNDKVGKAGRKTRFANHLEELLYMNNWYGSDSYMNGGRTTRRRSTPNKPSENVDQLVNSPKPKKPQLSFEQFLQEKEKQKQQLLLNQEKRRQKDQELKEKAKNRPIIKRDTLLVKTLNAKTYKNRERMALSLQEEANYFQSITGDGKPVEEDSKRKRKQATHIVPEYGNRPFLKKVQREIVKNRNKKRKLIDKKGSSHKVKKKNDSIEDIIHKEAAQQASDFVENEEEEEEEEEEEKEDEDEVEAEAEAEEDVSPYDPYNIFVDTQIPLNGRCPYDERIFTAEHLNDLKFIDVPLESDFMFKDTKELCYTDSLAAQIVLEHHKNYNDMPVSFPTLMITVNSGEKVINPLNKIRLRTVLYPQHSEEFVLAVPKRNELDPLLEIQKFIQIQFCLYFSHSDKIKGIVQRYCKDLENSVNDNDFPNFLAVIDKWNYLAIKLSPFYSLSKFDDINKEIRYYNLGQDNITKEFESDYEVVYNEIVNYDLSPMSNENQSGQELQDNSVYRHKFFGLLQNKKTISRFCMQQLLVRIYSRVVSTRSSKLKAYKAFTAEVYGELLPSFVSEVLDKVDLKPGKKFYDLGSGVGNTTFQAALEFGASSSGGCELMDHASYLTKVQDNVFKKHLKKFGLKDLNINFALSQSFVDNPEVKKSVLDCDVLIINNYLFDFKLNVEVGKLLYGIRPGTKIISLRNFITPRYKYTGEETIFDYLQVEKFEMSDFLSVSWTANKVPYYISTVQDKICEQYL